MPMMQKTLAEVLTVARASAGTVFDAAGNLTTVAANQPRFDYDPMTKAFKGLLVEEQRTNLLLWAEDLTSGYSGGGLDVSANYLKRQSAASSASRQRTGLSSPVGTPVTFSMWAKAGAAGGRVGMRIQSTYPSRADAVFDLVAGAVAGTYVNGFTLGPVAIKPLPGGWWLCSITATPTDLPVASVVFGPTDDSRNVSSWESSSAVLSDCYCDKRQLEQGAFPTSYIPTTNAAVTRAADVVQVVDGLWRGNSAHTLYVEASRPQISSGTFASLWSAGGNEMAIQSGASTPAQQRLWVGRQSSQQALISSPVSAVAGQVYKMAGTLSAGRAAYAQDGALVGAQAGVLLPVLQSLSIGSMGSSGFLNGHVRNVQYVDRVLSDADLVAVSQKGLAA